MYGVHGVRGAFGLGPHLCELDEEVVDAGGPVDRQLGHGLRVIHAGACTPHNENKTPTSPRARDIWIAWGRLIYLTQPEGESQSRKNAGDWQGF
jgi:hypothetical protein